MSGEQGTNEELCIDSSSFFYKGIDIKVNISNVFRIGMAFCIYRDWKRKLIL